MSDMYEAVPTIILCGGRGTRTRGVDDAGRVTEFMEKPQTSAGTISGGFMVFEREAIDRYIPADHDVMLGKAPWEVWT